MRRPQKRALFLFLIGAFLLTSSPLALATNFAAHKNKKAPLSKPLDSIQLGEHLRYEVSWMGVPVGFGDIEVKEKVTLMGREVYHVVAVARTNEFLSKIYPVEDEIHSWIDCETLYSVKFRKILREGRYRADEETVFDPVRKKGFYESLKNGEKKEFEIPGPIHDIISAFYWSRRQFVEPGSSIRTTVSSEEKNWDFEVQALERVTREIRGLGEMETLVVEPKTRLKGALYSRGRVWIYLTIDPRRVPAWITLKTPFGPITGVLQKS